MSLIASGLRFSTFALVAAIALSGCATDQTSQPEEVRQEDAISILLGSSFSELDPARSKDLFDFQILSQIYPTALRYSSSEPGVIEGFSETSKFNSETEFELKVPSGMRFENGNELSASDVAFSLNRFKKLVTSGVHYGLLKSFVSAKATDGSTVKVKLSEPFDLTFPHRLTSIAGLIVDEQVFNPDEFMTNEEIIASKPFAGSYSVESFANEGLLSLIPMRTSSALSTLALNNGLSVRLARSLEDYEALASSGKYDAILASRFSELSVAMEHTSGKTQNSAGSLGIIEGMRVLCGAKGDSVDKTVASLSESQLYGFARSLRISIETYIETNPLPKGARVWGSVVPSQLVGSTDALAIRERRSSRRESETEKTLTSEEELAEALKEAKLKAPIGVVINLADSNSFLTREYLTEIAGEWLKFGSSSDNNIAQITPLVSVAHFFDAASVYSLFATGYGEPRMHFTDSDWQRVYGGQSQEINQRRRAKRIEQFQASLANNSCSVPLVEVEPTFFLGPDFSYSNQVKTVLVFPDLALLERKKTSE